MKYTLKRFQVVAAALLKTHYGLELNDTELHDSKVVAQCINQGYRPYQVVAEHAAEADLDRIDKQAGFGVPSKAAITAADEDAAIAQLPIPSIVAASEVNDYVTAVSMYDAFTQGSGTTLAQDRAETLARYKPNQRAERWFQKMVDLGRGYLTQVEQDLVPSAPRAQATMGTGKGGPMHAVQQVLHAPH